jgi:tetratricopeptide (TPR) repeat protein
MKNILSTGLLIAGLAAPLASFAQTASVAQATATQPQGCRALILVDEKEMDLFLVKRSGDQLYFRMPNAPANAMSAIKFETVKQADFPFELEDFQIFEATRTRQWKQAAQLIIGKIQPCLPFLDLPKNNAVEPALEAGLYLMHAAAAERNTNGVPTAAATNLYDQAIQLYQYVAAAEWYPDREQAKLRSAMCQTACGRYAEAAKLIQSARVPEPGDGDYGLYQLAQGGLLFAQGKMLEACNAAARSVAFENKDPQVFPDALLLSARCQEELMDYHRARDIYFEVARLFGATEWGEQAFAKLTFIMDNQLTQEKEKAIIAKVFFGSEEDMEKIVKEFIVKRREQTDKQQ